VRSPGNLGTLLRTCLAVGARGVLVVGDADLYDPACVRATMGALSSLDVVRVADVAELRALARRSGARLVGTSPDARIDFRKTDYRGTTIIAVGCERRGITRAMRDACDVLVRIPMRNVIDSLNLAVAGSLVLYEAYAQRAT
jgi:TrmH family RNA methyltransferase